VLVSDAVATDGRVVRERDGAAYLGDGTLAGATVRVDEGVANLVAFGVAVSTAVAAATANPARVLGLGDRGRLVAGARADVNVLRPEDFRVREPLPSGSRSPRPR
jgi:N-acetylglucosamine-6-phosphate deacetylase